MAGRLAAWIHLNHPETGALVSLSPDDEVPGWAADLITNPAAWAPELDSDAGAAGEVSNDEVADTQQNEPPADTGQGTPPADTQQDTDTDDEPALAEPPRAGRGSSLEAWQSYVESRGIEFDESLSRDDLIALVDAAEQD